MKLKRFALGALWTNCYLVWDGNGDAFVVDPGGPAGDVADFIEENKLRLNWIILTHGHGDHIGGISDLRDKSLNGVAVHEKDAAYLTSASKNFSSYMGEPVEFAEADRMLSDGDLLKAGKIEIKVIHTPGHTLGGISLLVSEGEEKLLLSGDTLFARSIGRTDLPGGNEDTLMQSLKKLNSLPDELRVFPGHGPDTTIGEEKRHNPYWPR